LWDNYIADYVKHKEENEDLRNEHIYIKQEQLENGFCFNYFFPDKVVENIGLENIKDIMPCWSTYHIIPEEEKYKLAEAVKNNEV